MQHDNDAGQLRSGKGRRRHYCTHAPMNSRRKILLAFAAGMKERRRFPRTFTSFASTCLFWGFYFLLVATDMSPNENKRKPLIRSRAWIQTLFCFLFFSNRKRDGITGRCTLRLVCFISLISLKKYIVVWGRRRKNNWLWSNDVFWGLFSFFSFFNAVIVPSWPPSKSLPATPEELSLNGKWRGWW